MPPAYLRGSKLSLEGKGHKSVKCQDENEDDDEETCSHKKLRTNYSDSLRSRCSMLTSFTKDSF